MLKKLGFSRKRLSTKVLGKATPERIKEFSLEYMDLFKRGNLFVSIDESHFSEKCEPLYGYSMKGSRCMKKRVNGGWSSYSLVYAISSAGQTWRHIQKGAMKKADFIQFILDMPYPEGTVLLLDNCAIHKSMDNIYYTKGYIPLFLSPYSPEFQPVELVFSKLKGEFRSMVKDKSNHIPQNIDECLQNMKPMDIQGFFREAHRCISHHGILGMHTAIQ